MKTRAEQAGFTIIEMIVVVVLIGITGAVIISRFAEPNAFTVQAAQDGLLTTIRAAQQAALGRSAVTFEINLAGGNWQLQAKEAGTTIRTMEFSSSNVLLQTGSAASGDTCATGFDDDVQNDFLLTFDAKGNLAQFVNDGNPPELVDASFNGVRICVNNSNDESVCVSPAGYAYAGNCDD